MIPLTTKLDIQISKIEDGFFKSSLTKMLKFAEPLHEDETVFLRWTYKELSSEVDEKEVDMSAFRAWINKEYPELMRPYTRGGVTNFYYLIEMESCKWLWESFFNYCIKEDLI